MCLRTKFGIYIRLKIFQFQKKRQNHCNLVLYTPDKHYRIWCNIHLVWVISYDLWKAEMKTKKIRFSYNFFLSQTRTLFWMRMFLFLSTFEKNALPNNPPPPSQTPSPRKKCHKVIAWKRSKVQIKENDHLFWLVNLFRSLFANFFFQSWQLACRRA